MSSISSATSVYHATTVVRPKRTKVMRNIPAAFELEMLAIVAAAQPPLSGTKRPAPESSASSSAASLRPSGGAGSPLPHDTVSHPAIPDDCERAFSRVIEECTAQLKNSAYFGQIQQTRALTKEESLEKKNREGRVLSFVVPYLNILKQRLPMNQLIELILDKTKGTLPEEKESVRIITLARVLQNALNKIHIARLTDLIINMNHGIEAGKKDELSALDHWFRLYFEIDLAYYEDRLATLKDAAPKEGDSPEEFLPIFYDGVVNKDEWKDVFSAATKAAGRQYFIDAISSKSAARPEVGHYIMVAPSGETQILHFAPADISFVSTEPRHLCDTCAAAARAKSAEGAGASSAAASAPLAKRPCT